MKEFSYIIKEKVGIHLRPAKMLVDLGRQFDSQITLHKEDQLANVKHILALMKLGIKNGDRIIVKVEGSDEETASQEIERFFYATL